MGQRSHVRAYQQSAAEERALPGLRLPWVSRGMNTQNDKAHGRETAKENE